MKTEQKVQLAELVEFYKASIETVCDIAERVQGPMTEEEHQEAEAMAKRLGEVFDKAAPTSGVIACGAGMISALQVLIDVAEEMLAEPMIVKPEGFIQ